MKKWVYRIITLIIIVGLVGALFYVYNKYYFNDFVKAHDGEDFTAQDIADATGLSVRSVNGIVTSAFQRYKDEDKNEIPLMVRVPAEIEDPETGLHKAIKFIQLTDAGRNFVPTVED